jgi:TrmH family RNA methyltransferase
MSELKHREIQFYRSLHQKKGRYTHNCFIIEGVHLVEEALLSGFPIHEVLFSEQRNDKPHSIIQKIIKQNIPVRYIHQQDLVRLSSTESPQPILAVAPLPRMNHSIQGSAIYLYQINDPGNLGTIMRTALWYGVYHILLSADSCDPLNPKTVRASQGALFRIKLTVNMQLSELKSYARTYRLLVSDPACSHFPKVQNDFIAVFGSESHGLSQVTLDFPHQKFGVAKKGYGESLNLAVAAGIFLDRVT